MANKKLYYFRKNLGLCVRCGKPKFKSFILCLDCRDQHNYLNSEYRKKKHDKEYYKNRYKKNKKYSEENNLCIRCLNPRDSKYKICSKCREKIKLKKLRTFN
jgi:hypothetical protein